MQIRIKSWGEYKALALRTEALDTSRGVWQAQMPLRFYRVLHALMGLSTEVAELYAAILGKTEEAYDLVNIKEELGDLWWYMALLEDEIGPLPHVTGFMTSSLAEHLPLLSMHIGDAFDVLKRRMAYNSDDSDRKASWKTIDATNLYFGILHLTEELCGFDKYDVWEANIRKLYKRYPEKFSAERALQRNLDAERASLEGVEDD